MSATLTPISGDPNHGDAFTLPDLTGVNDFTICCYFRQTGYGGGGTSIAVPYIKNLTGFNDDASSYCFYFSDFGIGTAAAAAASWAGAGGETTTSLPAATLGVLRSFAVVKNGTVIKFWIDGSVVHTASGANTSGTAQHIRIGCHYGGGVNQYFEWAQISQWAFFKRAFTDPEIATFNTAHDSVHQHSLAIFTDLGISQTSLAYYLPLVTDAIEVHAGATVTTLGSPTFSVPSSRIRLAQIAPGGGDMLYIEMKKISDSSDVLGGTYNGGLTITPPGGPPVPLTLTQSATRMPFMWAPLDLNYESIQADSGAVLTGGTEALVGGNALATGLLRCLTFNEGSGSTLTDRATGAHNMTTRNSGVTTALTWGTATITGKGTGAKYVTFDGASNDATGSDVGLVTGAAARTFAFLVRTTDGGTGREFRFMAGYGPSGAAGFISIGVGQDGVGTGRPNVQANASNSVGAGPSTAFNDGAWHLMTFLFDGTNWKIYQDGTLNYTGTTAAFNTTLTGTWFLGDYAAGAGVRMACDLAGVWAWDHALSPTDLASFQATPFQMVSSSGSPWTTNTNADNGIFGWHNSGDVNRFTRSFTNQFSQSSSPSAVATWTFSNVPPGKYVVVVIYHADTDRTSQATYTIKDGATTVATFTQDQRVTMRYDTASPSQGEFNAIDGRRAMILGTDPKLTAPLFTANLVTIATGTTVTVALTNTAGSGVMTANLMCLRRIIQPYPTGSVLNAPSAWCTTSAGDAEAVVNFPVDVPNIDTFMPFSPASTRTMTVGYNIDYHKFGRTALLYADRMLASDEAWGGSGFTVDSGGDQNLTGVTGFAARTFDAQPIQRSYDGAVLPTIKEVGTWTIKYTVVTGTPSVTIHLGENHGEILGTPTTPTLVGGKMVFTQTIDTRGTIHPGAASLYVQVSGGAAKIEIYGPEVPSGWTSIYHPSMISLLAGRRFDVIRANPLEVTFNMSEVDWTDAPSETASSTLTPRTVRQFTVTTAGPVNRADLLPWYGAVNGCCAALVTTAAPHGIRTGDFIFMPLRDNPSSDGVSEDGNGWGITTTLGHTSASIFRATPRFCIRKDATNFIWLGFGPNSGEVDITDPNQCITLTGSHTFTGTITVKTGRYSPHAHLVGLCAECGIRTYHINMPMFVSDAYVTSLADRMAAFPTVKIRLASRGNEVWNAGLPQTQQALIAEHHTQYLWDTTSHAQGAPVGAAEGYAFLAWRLQQDAVIFRARFAAVGRPPTDVITVLEGALGGTSHTGQACNFSSAVGLTPFDELDVATYRDLIEDMTQSPANPSVGYTTDFYLGVNNVSDSSLVSLIWLGQRYSNLVANIQGHRAVLDAHTGVLGFVGKPIGTYEGGDQNIAPGRPRPSSVYRNPLMYRKELAVLQMIQNGGLSMENRYVLNYPDGPQDGAQWNDFLTSFMDVGTGATSEGQSPLDMRSGETTATFGPAAPSQEGGARRFWASVVTGNITVSAHSSITVMPSTAERAAFLRPAITSITTIPAATRFSIHVSSAATTLIVTPSTAERAAFLRPAVTSITVTPTSARSIVHSVAAVTSITVTPTTVERANFFRPGSPSTFSTQGTASRQASVLMSSAVTSITVHAAAIRQSAASAITSITVHAAAVKQVGTFTAAAASGFVAHAAVARVPALPINVPSNAFLVATAAATVVHPTHVPVILTVAARSTISVAARLGGELLEPTFGRFQAGTAITLELDLEVLPDDPPVVQILDPLGAVMGTYELPVTADPQVFSRDVLLGGGWVLGIFTVRYTWSTLGVPHTLDDGFTLVGGGDGGGQVIGLFAHGRPETRSVIAQLGSGHLVQGAGPSF